MKTYKVELTEDFIKEAEDAACPEWKIKIRNLIPEAFENRLEIGEWYYYKENILFCYTGDYKGYGITDKWKDLIHVIGDFNWRRATEEEVEKALIKEAEKRGLVKGVKFKGVLFNEERMINGYSYDIKDNALYSELRGCGGDALFRNGDWVEPIENSTLKRIEEIEAELKQLKESL